MSCLQILRRRWPHLILRWGVFALLMAGFGLAAGWDLRETWPMILFVSGAMNVIAIWLV